MNLLFYVYDNFHLEFALNRKVDEVLVGIKGLSRLGGFSVDNAVIVLRKLRDNGIKTIVDWDILMTESEFHQAVFVLNSLSMNDISAIRVQDMGAYFYLLEKYDCPIHLNLETGNHNYEAINGWIEQGISRVERVVLSIEIQKNILSEIISKLSTPVELLGSGPILLFYTPRKLLNPVYGDSFIEDKFYFTSSEESPHSGFPVVENKSGTYMFNTKDHFILEDIDELQKIGISTLRIDTRQSPEVLKIASFNDFISIKTSMSAMEFKSNYPKKVIQGFFKANKSDVLFKKLKNQNLGDRGEHYIGQVIDVKKKKHIGILIKRKNCKLSKNDHIRIMTPEGKVKDVTIKEMILANGQSIELAQHDDIVFINHVGGVSVKSEVYFCKDEKIL